VIQNGFVAWVHLRHSNEKSQFRSQGKGISNERKYLIETGFSWADLIEGQVFLLF
jgi:hypothetical protein